jgi:hypothetical protein
MSEEGDRERIYATGQAASAFTTESSYELAGLPEAGPLADGRGERAGRPTVCPCVARHAEV